MTIYHLRATNEKLSRELHARDETIAELRLTWTDTPPTELGDYKIEIHVFHPTTAFAELKDDGMFHLYRGPHSEMVVSPECCTKFAGPYPEPKGTDHE